MDLPCGGERWAGEWCKDCPEFGRECDNALVCDTCRKTETAPYEVGDLCYCGGRFVERPEQSICDKCGGSFNFDTMVICPPIDDPQLLCPDCYAKAQA